MHLPILTFAPFPRVSSSCSSCSCSSCSSSLSLSLPFPPGHVGHQSLTGLMQLRDNLLVSGNADSTLRIWDVHTGQYVACTIEKEAEKANRAFGSKSHFGFMFFPQMPSRSARPPVLGDKPHVQRQICDQLLRYLFVAAALLSSLSVSFFLSLSFFLSFSFFLSPSYFY
mgnify:CR=1 FL=1